MLPSVALGISVEKLRDGGSLCAYFQGSNGSQYWLVLPVQLAADHIATGYGSPVLVERPFAAEEIQVSWAHAAILLRQIEQLLPPDQDLKWVNAMYQAIRHEGKWIAK